jgi:hypothetical protein
MLTQNPKPNPGQRENINNSFAAMKKDVGVYCTNTNGTRNVLVAFNNAETEWQLLLQELG